MPDPLVLYSANTLLAYRINERYYHQNHFAWCAPFFSVSGDSIDIPMPPSSTPCDICRKYLDDIQRQDRHSSSIHNNREGLRSGMAAKREAGVITPEQHQEIERIVSEASVGDFRPLLYIIPFNSVRDLIQPVPPHQKAHPFSPEYKIEDLPRSRFDVLDWQWR
ncbi:MAG TPA: hypothetical protein VKK31_01300 [Thermoanaerobaculia bacterium]|nr:hypothetical protein [Thermoanaerobaculia bacterium]